MQQDVRLLDQALAGRRRLGAALQVVVGGDGDRALGALLPDHVAIQVGRRSGAASEAAAVARVGDWSSWNRPRSIPPAMGPRQAQRAGLSRTLRALCEVPGRTLISARLPACALESRPMSFTTKAIIESVLAREILDSRGNPTIEVDVTLDSGAVGTAAVPSGASTGEHEALELRDGDKKRYLGKGVLKAVRERRRRSSGPVVDRPATPSTRPASTTRCSRPTARPTRARLGANAILGVSMAAARAAADELGPAALQVPRRAGRARAAGAADEHHQRRRARRQLARLPGVHDRPEGAADASPRRCAPAPRCSTR